MRIRVGSSILGTTVMLIALAFAWRAVFPFPDTLAVELPPDTLAYAHGSLTTTVRRALEHHALARTAGDPAASSVLAEAVAAAVRTPEIRELGLVLAGTPSGALRIEFLVRGAPGVAARDGATFRAWGLPGIVRVLPSVPPEAVTPRARHPVTARIHPRAIAALPTLRLEAAAHLLPEELAFAGVLDRGGFALSSRPRIRSGVWWPVRLDLPVPLNHADIQLLGFPVRETVALLDAPLHRDLVAAIAPVLPDRADIALHRSGPTATVRLPTPTHVPPEATRALLGILALAFPETIPTVLDGFAVAVLRADADRFTVHRGHGEEWEVRTVQDKRVIMRITQGSGRTTLHTGRPFTGVGGPTHIRIPGRCTGGAGWTSLIVGDWSYPQRRVAATVSWDGAEIKFCGFS